MLGSGSDPLRVLNRLILTAAWGNKERHFPHFTDEEKGISAGDVTAQDDQWDPIVGLDTSKGKRHPGKFNQTINGGHLGEWRDLVTFLSYFV